MKKKTILVLADHPLSPSGVGTQTKYMIEALLKTGRYRFICFGGAVKHRDYAPQNVEGYEEDWVIFPVNGYGTPDMIRSVLRQEKPDVLWFMTDPRFWGWLWEMEDEIRPLIPMIYYHVWDNYPYPTFNATHYESNDVVATISKLTDDIVRTVSPSVECIHVPHAVDNNIFKAQSSEDRKNFREKFFNGADEEKVIFFWNNRNARRKQSGTLIFWFKEFLDMVGHDKASLLMHTEVKDEHGQDLEAIIHNLGITKGQVRFSTHKVPPEQLAMIYDAADCTINISDAEGFGLATLESLSCETPIIVNMTGGLQEQVTDGEEWFGVGIEPKAKAVIGSQQIPFIHEDRITKEDFLDAMMKIYNMTSEERKQLGKKGRQHVLNNYSLEKYEKKWIDTFDHVVEKYGSWETRTGYDSWSLKEV